jgi:hypothetical protein
VAFNGKGNIAVIVGFTKKFSVVEIEKNEKNSN